MKLTAKAATPVLVVALVAILGLSGCKTVSTFNSKHDTTFGKKQKVTNVHASEQSLPAHLRRVALLPIYQGAYDHIDMTQIEESFNQELAKRRLFELVVVDDERMNEIFGEESFSSVEALPTKLLSKLHEIYAIDGVMLIDITYYKAYQPVGIGVRAKLLDGHTGEIVWAADELFDGANPQTSNAARKFFQNESVNQYPLQRTQTVLHSTARFSKYVANAVYDTIPLPR